MAKRRDAAPFVTENAIPPQTRTAVRLAVASTFNVEPLGRLLRSTLDASGFRADISLAPFGQIFSAFLAPESTGAVESPDPAASRTIAVLIVSCEDDLAAFFRRPSAFAEDDVRELVDSRVAILSGCVSALAPRVEGILVIVLGAARAPAVTGLRPARRRRRRDVIERYTSAVLALDGLAPNVVTLDWIHELLASGVTLARDPRLWYLARMRLDLKGLAALAEVIARHIRALLHPARKAVIVDLDDTLWGGVLDEVGVDALELGDEGVGLAFADLQRELLKLHEAGVAVALCSRNDRTTAVSAIERHAGMVLRTEHLAAMCIDWRDKAAMIREIADHLGFGLDSLVFLDDNPVEREWVRRALPDVLVPELPRDPALRPEFVAALEAFDRVELTDVDVRRERSHKAARRRDAHAQAITDYDEFLASLSQQIDIAPLQPSTLPRAAQLSERANQFTLGPRRYTVGELAALSSDPQVEVCTAVVRDRFEDSGITGLTIVRFTGTVADVEAWLLSCRVLGRRIEDGLLAFLAGRAIARGATELRVHHSETTRNSAVKAFLVRLGLVEGDAGDGRRVFSLPLGAGAAVAPWPAHLTLQGEFAS